MAHNIEIKARIDGIAAVLPKARLESSNEPVEIYQDDAFFHCANGRLKLRMFDDTHGQLIFYQRADQTDPKPSFYLITDTAQPHRLRELLTAAHGIIGRVVKHRTLILAGRTRIHLDRVENLGELLELEVVLAKDENPAQGIAEAHALMARLGISPDQLIADAYLDMLGRQRASSFCSTSASGSTIR